MYENIAPHFDSTRFSRWPAFARFLASLPVGSLMLDAGCGNGKYLQGDGHLFKVGFAFFLL